MAKILKFEPRERLDSEPDNRDRPSGPADIVIFPGVRVEREAFKLSDRLDDPENSTKRPRRRSKQTRK
jgi:hypothetical protein